MSVPGSSAVYERLRAEIVGWQLSPGTPLKERRRRPALAFRERRCSIAIAWRQYHTNGVTVAHPPTH
jgi:hypothetical protein